MTDQDPAAGCRWPPARATVAAAALVAALAIAPLPAAGAAAAASPRGPAAAAARGGTLRAWGDNRTGQLGDGTTTRRDAPVKVLLPPGTRIISVRAGCLDTVALTSSGQVLAWGNNNQGQLGNGTTTSSVTPVKVMLPPGTKVRAIRAGCEHNLAITTDGHLLAWGFNADGELGDGTITDRDTPVQVKAPRVRVVSAGFEHSLAVTAKGKVLAWGDNSSGQLGDGRTTSSDAPVRVRLPHGVKVTAVAAGDSHSLALTSKGKVLAWGRNTNGQLGNGSTRKSDRPVRTRLPRRTRVRGLFAGCFHSLALTSRHKVLGWGSNGTGQLGDGTHADRHRPVRTRFASGTRVTAISAGCFHSLARTSKGHVLAWGDNNSGELGIGRISNQSDHPRRVKLPAGLPASAIGSGPDALFSLAIVRRA